ncbi:MAG: hypothetical protein ACRENE_20175, partial [Polyangiaceae bacterium]
MEKESSHRSPPPSSDVKEGRTRPAFKSSPTNSFVSASAFSRPTAKRATTALGGIETTGYTLWFAELMSELGHELAVGDAAKIRASEPRKQKYDD